MKNFLLILSASLMLFSCKKNGKTETSSSSTQDSANSVKQFVVDSLRVNDSLVISKNLTTAFNKQLLLFPSIKNKVILDSIYKEAMVETKAFDATTLKSALTQEMQKSFAKTKEDSKEWTSDSKQTWDDTSAMKVISNQNDILTLQYSGSGFTGGAHGYYFENYKAFDLKNNKVLSQNDIFKNPNDAAWHKILNDHFTNKDQREMLLADKITLNNNFYFDNQKITFVYNQYEITAYAAGVVYITINFSDIKNQLKPEFITQFKIK